MSLITKISKGRQVRPLRLLVHGEGGTGKSTFFSGAPDPLFIDPEQRTGHLDVTRFTPETWVELLAFMKEVILSRPCKTLVFSTIDFMEGMVWSHLCKREGTANIEDLGGGWGKGFSMARDEFSLFLAGVEKLVSVGINVGIESHSEVETFRNPIGADFDRWNIKLHKRTRPIFIAKMDAIGFACWEDFAKKKDKTEKAAKAITTGERVLTFGHNPACQTKAGFPLPDQIPLSWAEFAKHLNTGSTKENA